MHLHCKRVWFYGQTCDYRGQQAQRWGGMICTSPRTYRAGVPHLFISLLGRREGTCPACSVSGRRRNSPQWIKRASAAEAGADRPAGRAYPCDRILWGWRVASSSSFSEMCPLIRGWLLVYVLAASPWRHMRFLSQINPLSLSSRPAAENCFCNVVIAKDPRH